MSIPLLYEYERAQARSFLFPVVKSIPEFFKNILFLSKNIWCCFSIMTADYFSLLGVSRAGETTLTSNKKPGLLLIGYDQMLGYLLRRFAERCGYRILATQASLSGGKINASNLAAIVFLSTEQLEKSQALVEELASHDTPILVCSSVADEIRARELGADYCLLHPLTYDNFCAILSAVNTSRQN